jgi:hypothetical protein
MNEPAPAAPLDALIARCRADVSSHMTGGACPEEDLRQIEAMVRQPLPAPFRAFLSDLGGGVFYLKHEIFGPRRVMIHDIELVPDLLSFRTWLGTAVPPNMLPIHRADGRIHAVDLGTGAVRPLGITSPCYADFTTFLERVVLP